jgi:hypothetical protein
MRRLAPFALAALLFASPAMAQDAAAPAAPAAPMAGHAHAMGPGTGMSGGGCAGMMAKMDSSNARIASLTEAMNKATGSKKTEAMAAVINAMVQDRLAMQAMMHQMHSQMMGGMGGMGAMGGQSGCSAGMECCKGQAMDCCKAGATSCSAPAAAPEKKE